MLRYRDRATPMNNDGMIKLGEVRNTILYQTEPNLSIFSESDLLHDYSFCSQIHLTIIAVGLNRVFLLESFS